MISSNSIITSMIQLGSNDWVVDWVDIGGKSGEVSSNRWATTICKLSFVNLLFYAVLLNKPCF